MNTFSKYILAFAMMVFVSTTYASKTILDNTVFNATDVTNVIRNAINSTVDTVIVKNVGQPWIIQPLTIFDKVNPQTIIFEPNVVLQAKSGVFTTVSGTLFKLKHCSNVNIVGYGATFHMLKSEYTVGEHRHAIDLSDCSNITISGLLVNDSGGDGLIITAYGAYANFYTENVLIRDCVFDNNRRQGCSIITAKNVTIENCTFSNTKGTLPEAGIDIEPDLPLHRIENINIRKCRFTNNFGHGIEFAFHLLASTTTGISVVVEDCYFSMNHDISNVYAETEISYTDNALSPVTGSITFNRCFVDGSNWSAFSTRKSAAGVQITFNDCVFKNVSQSTASTLNHPIWIEVQDYSSTLGHFGGVQFNNSTLSYTTNYKYVRINGWNTSLGVKDVQFNGLTIIHPTLNSISNNSAVFSNVLSTVNCNFNVNYLSAWPSKNFILTHGNTQPISKANCNKKQISLTSSSTHAFPVAINYSMSGSALNGLDFRRLNQYMLIKGGANSRLDTLEAINPNINGSNSLQVSLTPVNNTPNFTNVATGFYSNIITSCPNFNAYANIPAFPGAEGYGRWALGGRGGRVIYVTNLNDTGPGSFRAACEASGPRIVMFKVSGLISLYSRIHITNPYIYIAGQSAPGDGICIRGGQLSVNTHNVVVRYIRSRAGDNAVYNSGVNPDNRDAFEIQNPDNPPYNVIFDHCSASWGIDETMSTWYPCRDITIQWCIVAEGLHNSLHSEGVHGKGLLIGDGARKISLHHNLFAKNFDRNPMIKGSTTTELINNVIYGWGSDNYNGVYIGLLDNEGHTGLEPTFSNIIGNYLKTFTGSFNTYSIRANGNMEASSKLFFNDNIGPNRMSDAQNQLNILRGADWGWTQTTPVGTLSGVTTTTSWVAYNQVLSFAGANLPKRDATDVRIVNDVKNGTGSIVNSQTEVGGWATYNSTTPPTDTDSDGMPDCWEISKGLNPNSSIDGNNFAPSGYTWVEEYINGDLVNPCNILAINTNSLNYAASASIQTVSITSNVNWSISGIPTWLSVSTTSGYGNRNITISAAVNTTSGIRTAFVTIQSLTNSLTQSLNITQSGSALMVSYYNSDRNFIYKNKPFFPFGFYGLFYSASQTDKVTSIKRSSQSGMNIMAVVNADNNVGDVGFQQLMDTASKYKMNFLMGASSNSFLHWRVEQVKNHPSIFGYTLSDDGDDGTHSLIDLQTTENQVLAKDNTRVTHITLTGFDQTRRDNASTYMAIPDFCSYQCYPIGQHRFADFTSNLELRQTYIRTLEYVQKAEAVGKPFVMLPQTFNWGSQSNNPRYPTFSELRNMVYCGLAAGVKGIIAYDYSNDLFVNQSALWTEYSNIASDVASLKSFLFTPSLIRGGNPSNDIVLSQWTLADTSIIVAINTSYSNSKLITHTISGISNGIITQPISRIQNNHTLTGNVLTIDLQPEKVFVGKVVKLVPSLLINPISAVFSGSGSSQNISITSNLIWTVTGLPTWLTVSTTSGYGNRNISISAAVNTTSGIRTAFVTIQSLTNSLIQSLTITQTGVTSLLGNFTDNNGNLLVNGQAFFPMGFYADAQSTTGMVFNLMQSSSSIGMNMTFAQTGMFNITQLDQIFTFATTSGIKLIPTLHDLFDDNSLTTITNLVNRYKTHPALFAWNIFDDANVKSNASSMLTMTGFVNNLDPNHATYQPITTAVFGDNSMGTYAKITHATALEWYPVKTNYANVPYTFNVMSQLVDTCKKYKKTPIAIIQTYRWEESALNRWPTAKEIDVMAYSSLIAGVKGMTYYTFKDYDTGGNINTSQPQIWNQVKTITSEINSMLPFIQHGKHTKGRDNDGGGSMFFSYWEYLNDVYVIVVNSSELYFQDIDIKLPVSIAGAAVSNLMPSRPFTMTLSSNTLSGVLAPQSVQFYKLTSPNIIRTYYVSKTGNDNNSGTFSQPFLTLQKAANVMMPGDTTYVRSGVFNELLTISVQGTITKNAVYKNYQNEVPTINGAYLIPNGNLATTDPISGKTADNFPLVMIRGSYIIFSGFEITSSAGVGISVTNYANNTLCYNNIVSNCKIRDCRNKGMWIYNSNNNLIKNNEIYQTANFASYDRSGNPDWPSCLGSYGCNGLSIVGNNVHENWGEGIGIWNNTNSLVQDNTIYDSMSGNLYLDNSLNTTISGNLIYNTQDPRFSTNGNGSDGINIADEPSVTTRGSSILMINNVIYGCQNSIRWRNFQANSGLKDVSIFNNTFVNPFDGRPIDFEAGSHSNVQIRNNIIRQDNTSYGLINIAGSIAAFTFSNNLWSRIPSGVYTTTSDIFGNSGLSQSGSTTQGQLTKSWFEITSTSSAINKGLQLSQVTKDFYNNSRTGSIDIGAHEFLGVPAVLIISSNTLIYSSTGSSQTVSVTSNLNWSVSGLPAWLSVSTTSGSNNKTLSFTALNNTSTGIRTVSVTIQSFSPSIIRSLTITQTGTAASLSYAPANQTFSAAGGTNGGNVSSNISWTVSNTATWLTPSVTSGSNSGSLGFSASANTSTGIRTTVVTLSGGALTYFINVTQTGAAASLVANPNTLNYASVSSSQNITITGNISWTSTSSQPWLTLTGGSGSSNGTISATAAVNTATGIRTAQVTISGSGITRIVNITQSGAGASLVATPTTLNYASTSSAQVISITSNVTWASTSSQSWLTLTGGSGTNNGTISATAAANTATGIRIAQITVSGSGLSQIINITQAGAGASLVASPLTLSYASGGSSQNIGITSNISWTSVSSQPWLTLTGGSGTNNGSISATASLNTSTGIRIAQVTVSGSGLSQIINITQTGTAASLVASPLTLSYGSVGSSQNIGITSNISWTSVSSQPWLTLTGGSGTNNGTISATASVNTASGIRIAQVTVSGSGLSQIINITQAGTSAILVANLTTLTYSSASSSQNFAISSNVNWSLSSLPAWLSVNTSTGFGNASILLTAQVNSLTISRSHNITISGGGLSQIINITQSGAATSLVANPTTLAYPSGGSSRNVTISSNVNWTVTGIPTWLTLNTNSGIGNTVISLVSQSHNFTSSRSATITIQSLANSLTQSINITQSGSPTTLSLSGTTLNFNSASSSQTLNIITNDNWIVAGVPTWLTINPQFGTGNATLNVQANTNTSVNNRNVILTITSGSLVRTATVNQSGQIPQIQITNSSNSNLNANGEIRTISISSNVNWTINASDNWFSVTPFFGTGNVQVSIQAFANSNTTPRNGSITISGNGISQFYNFTQDASNQEICTQSVFISVSPDTLDFTNGTTIRTSTITSNLEYQILSDANWFAISTATGIIEPCQSSKILTVSILPTTVAANGSNIITLKSGGLEKKIVIKSNVKFTTGVDEKEIESKLEIYPNPAKSQKSIKFNKIISFKMYNIIGNEVGGANSVMEYDLGVLQSGIYFIKTSENEFVKLIID